jgi:hypothetical protein
MMNLHLHNLENAWSTKTVAKTMLAGLVATASMDLWAFLIQYLFAIPVSWNEIGRIVGHGFMGSLSWQHITRLPPIPYENLYGWLFHYFIGISYACLYVFLKREVFKKPMTWYSAIIFGWAMMVFPLVFLSYLLGKGLFYDQTLNQWHGLLYTFSCHTAFGLGLIICLVLFHKQPAK